MSSVFVRGARRLIVGTLLVGVALPSLAVSPKVVGAMNVDDAYGLYPGDPFSSLNADELAAFDQGLRWFATEWSPRQGLGPAFNGRSCVECHGVPTAGGTAYEVRRHLRLVPDSDGKLMPLPRYTVNGPGISSSHAQIVRRRPPALYGIGLLERIPETTLYDFADPDDADGDGVRGQVRHTPEGLGRFGWDAGVANLEDFVTEAFLVELGVTPEEARRRGAAESIDPIRVITFFIRNLAAPRPHDPSEMTRQGEVVFRRIGCTKCHRDEIALPPSKGVEGPLIIRPYSDLLLHRLDDNASTPPELRTPPLWGLKAAGPPYLHNGSAPSIEAALLAHGGEAASVRARLRALPDHDRAALIAFLESL